MAEKLIEIGKIINTHGLRGEVKVTPWLDYPEMFEAFTYIYTENNTRYDIKSVKYQKSNLLVKFSGIEDINQAEKLKNQIFRVEGANL